MKPVELYDHQRKAVAKLHNGSILTGGVGTGKSRVALRYYIEKEAPRDVYVITTAKKRDSFDWESEAILHGVGITDSIPVARNNAGSFVLPGRIVVDSWNNLTKYTEVENAFFIFDEQRLVGYGAWAKAFLRIARRNRWILLSATPGDTWMDYVPVFIANGFYKNKTEFTQEHVIWTPRVKFPKVLRYRGEGQLIKYRNQILVDMPYERHTKRVVEQAHVEYDRELLDRVVKDRWHVYENRPLRDVAELFSVMRKVVNSDTSRLNSIRELLSKHPKLIVFYNFDYELEILRTLSQTTVDGVQKPLPSITQRFNDSEANVTQSPLINGQLKMTGPGNGIHEKSTLAIAEWNGHKHEPIPKTDSWVYLVQYRAGAEGWNCTDTDTVVFYSLTYSYRDFEQAMGRIDRMNTKFTNLYYYVFRSTSLIDKAIWRALSMKKDFNARRTAKELNLMAA